MYSVGEVIRAARQQRGWCQRTLAAASGVAQPNIAAIERGARAPSLAMLDRLVRTCGQQLRYELEPRHADVDAEVAALLDRQPPARVQREGLLALVTASRLARAGLRLVLDGVMAARLCGAPVADLAERIWCDHTAVPQLREVARRCHLDLRPLSPRYDVHGRIVLGEGDQVRIGLCQVLLGTPPSARWRLNEYGGVLVVGVQQLLADPGWAPADRVAVRRLAVALTARGEAAHGLDSLT